MRTARQRGSQLFSDSHTPMVTRLSVPARSLVYLKTHDNAP